MEGPLASLWSKPMDPVVAAVGHDLGYLFEAAGSFWEWMNFSVIQ